MAVRFDAADDRIYLAATLPAPASTGLTVLGWWRIRVDRHDYSAYYRTSTAGGATIHTVETWDTGLSVNVFTASGQITDTYINAVDEWVALAVVDDGSGTVRSYVRPLDGATVTKSGAIATGTPGQICIGGRSSTDSSEWLNGTTAYVRVFADTLTQAELETEWDSTSAVLTAWADWPLFTADDLTDHSGNGRDLTPVGAGPTTEVGPPLAITYDKSGGAAVGAGGTGVVQVATPVTHARVGGAAVLASGTGRLSVSRPGSIRGRLRAGAPVAVGRLHAGPETIR